ncbi:acyl-CoA dehydrogenase family protein [Sandaracinus amylolyticus]|uniref:Butyryl-CoA dehydrogenase n=1 Tax=Sandaracinus amylolyticus TaxID=927083 RepID=A0A0F6W0A5_9BACT|nr:acyl-CoA dehydrogenase family protein [Sandaracinus amylolyticus]AKF04175.1 Butyryl-CoA dehydrogenase [Sandaracinus amylolyticus]
MDFEWDEETRAVRAHVMDVARRMFRRDRREARDLRATMRELGTLGVLGMPIPEVSGGNGAGVVAAVAALEALGEAGIDGGTAFSLGAQVWAVQMPILAFGSDAQKDAYLRRLCTGEIVGAIALSEPGAGSDLFSMRTRAEERGDRVVLHGRKAWITNAPIADVFIVLAAVGEAAGTFVRTAAFLVERDTPGLIVEALTPKLGLEESPMAEVVLDGCEVPKSAMLGRWGRGAEIFEHALTYERGALAAPFVGAMKRQLDACVEHAVERRQFGSPIGAFQAVSHRIADMKLRLETARLLLHRFAHTIATGADATLEAALVKLHVSESYVQSSLDAIQLHGASGYATELGVHADLRDAIGLRIASGTNEIQRSAIARSLGVG